MLALHCDNGRQSSGTGRRSARARQIAIVICLGLMPAALGTCAITVHAEPLQTEHIESSSNSAVVSDDQAASAIEATDTPPSEQSTNVPSEPESTVQPETSTEQAQPSNVKTNDAAISYSAHISELGWQDPSPMGEIAGSTGKNLALEALSFECSGFETIDLQVRCHISDLGWQPYQTGDQIAGTVGQARHLEAISIKLSGSTAQSYDVYYQVHVSNIGWLDWASNGANAGTVGYGYPIEAIKITLVEKGTEAPGPTQNPFRDRAQEPPALEYQAHVRNTGWQSPVTDGKTSGTTGKGLSIEAVRASASWYAHTGTVEMRAHVSDIGWMEWKSGECGTTGRGKPVEALQVRLTGQLAEAYDVWYRVHVSEIGWMGWTSNGEPAGTSGKALQVEAIEIRLVEKGSTAPGDSTNSWQGQSESMSGTLKTWSGKTHSSSGDSLILGAPEASAPAIGMTLQLNNLITDGSIQYRGLFEFSGWSSWQSDGRSLNSGDAQQIEAVQIKLAGSISSKYSVWYRVHNTSNTWSGWATNGEPAGFDGFGSGINAVEICIVKVGSATPGPQDGAMSTNTSSTMIRMQAHSADIGWQQSATDGIVGTQGKAQPLQAFRIDLKGAQSNSSIEVQAHVAELGWQPAVSNGAVSGTTGKNLPMEALKLRLTGPAAETYELFYRVHVSDFGWLGWTKNGQIAGTTGLAKNIEAIEVRLVPTGAQLPATGIPSYISLPSLASQAYITGEGWTKSVGNGEIVGTTGKAKTLEALKIDVPSQLTGSVSYSVHVSNVGWMNSVTDNATAGIIGQGQKLEAIKISLTGDLSKYFDIWYRAHVEQYGWLGWTKNGNAAGTGSLSYRMEALQIKITPKGVAAPGSTQKPFTDKPFKVNYALLDVPCLLQMPQLPTGCESVALTNTLNYYGFGLSKTTMADSYIPRSNWDFVTSFWGDPHSARAGNCCSAPAITNAANKFLAQRGSSLRAYDVSGISLEGMYSNIQDGAPVIVWSTMYQQPIGQQYAWQNYNGKRYFTVTNSHTIVLRGFDRNTGNVYIADSLSGYKTVDASWFNRLYIQRGSQAVVIK